VLDEAVGIALQNVRLVAKTMTGQNQSLNFGMYFVALSEVLPFCPKGENIMWSCLIFILFEHIGGIAI